MGTENFGVFTSDEVAAIQALRTAILEDRFDVLKLARRDGPEDCILCVIVQNEDGGSYLVPLARMFRPQEDPGTIYSCAERGVVSVSATIEEMQTLSHEELVERSRQP